MLKKLDKMNEIENETKCENYLLTFRGHSGNKILWNVLKDILNKLIILTLV